MHIPQKLQAPPNPETGIPAVMFVKQKDVVALCGLFAFAGAQWFLYNLSIDSEHTDAQAGDRLKTWAVILSVFGSIMGFANTSEKFRSTSLSLTSSVACAGALLSALCSAVMTLIIWKGKVKYNETLGVNDKFLPPLANGLTALICLCCVQKYKGQNSSEYKFTATDEKAVSGVAEHKSCC